MIKNLVVNENEVRLATNGLDIDLLTQNAFYEGKNLNLTALEFRLLAFLVANDGKSLSKDEITKVMWQNGAIVVGRSVDTHISRLRKKGLKKFIHSERKTEDSAGMYKFESK
jgi:DNA-binding response OmpR family regulator